MCPETGTGPRALIGERGDLARAGRRATSHRWWGKGQGADAYVVFRGQRPGVAGLGREFSSGCAELGVSPSTSTSAVPAFP